MDPSSSPHMTDRLTALASETLTPRLSAFCPFSSFLPTWSCSLASSELPLTLLASPGLYNPEGITEQRLTRQTKPNEPQPRVAHSSATALCLHSPCLM